MPRKIRDDEVQLVLRLIGPQFAQIDVVEEQLRNCRVEDLAEGNILEFLPVCSRKLKVTRSVLGQGSCRDLDGVPIVFSLLQQDGYLWRLDISRADGQQIRARLDYAAVIALGFGEGLSLEDGRSE